MYSWNIGKCAPISVLWKQYQIIWMCLKESLRSFLLKFIRICFLIISSAELNVIVKYLTIIFGKTRKIARYYQGFLHALFTSTSTTDFQLSLNLDLDSTIPKSEISFVEAILLCSCFDHCPVERFNTYLKPASEMKGRNFRTKLLGISKVYCAVNA